MVDLSFYTIVQLKSGCIYISGFKLGPDSREK